jgi:hypothetical protein
LPALQPVLLIATVLLVGVCTRVCAGIYGRHRAALPSDRAMKRWRRELVASVQESTRHETDADAPQGISSGSAGVESAAPEAAVSDPAVRDATTSPMVMEERVLREVLAARSRPAAVLAMNELTSEISHCLEDARTLPPAVGRVALLGGTALGLTAMATALQNEQGNMAAAWGGACLLLAMGGAGVCGMYGRLARRAAERRRDGVQELVRLLERRLPPPSAGPAR